MSGAAGITGPQGTTGFVGSRGDTGFTGSQGIQGVTGFTGSIGNTGDTGVQGNIGFTGSTGNTGYTGSAGPVAGSANQVVYKDGSNNAAGDSAFTYNSSMLTTPLLTVSNSQGDEGGELLLVKPQTNTSIAGTGITVDVWQSKLRIFEQGGSARGGFIDVTTLANQVGTHIVHYKSTVPSTNKGTTGDLKGHYAISGNDLYVCNANYTDGTANIWVKITGTSSW